MTAEALALLNRLVALWNRTDGRTPQGKRLQRVIARAGRRFDRRLAAGR